MRLVPTKVRRILKPVAQRFGLIEQQTREAWALKKARLDTEARLAVPPARVAIIGCGTMGRDIARAAKMLTNWSITAIYDQRTEAANKVRSEIAPEAIAYDSIESLLSHSSDYDLLAIATWAPSHVSIALNAIEAGARKILVEKPLATSLADSDTLIREAARANAVIGVDHTRRWNPSGEGIKRLIRSGVIGEPRAVHFTFGRAGFGMIGTHLFDFGRWLTGADILQLRAELDDVVRPDWRGERFLDQSGRCEARLSNGVRLTVDLSDDLPLQQAFFVVTSERGRLEVDERLGRIRLIGTGGRAWEEDYLGGRGSMSIGVATSLLELHTKNRTRCTLQDGRAALEAAIACQLSAREGGRWVTLPLAGEVYEEQFPFA